MLVAGVTAGQGCMLLENQGEGRVGKALRSGFSAWLAAVLVMALLCSPLVARHQGFNHYHPEGTPEHYHSIDSTLGSPVMTDVIVITVFMTVLVVLVFRSGRQALPLRCWPANQARAPPGLRAASAFACLCRSSRPG
jgi:cytochrome bd-type quinol oxidase subunit 2